MYKRHSRGYRVIIFIMFTIIIIAIINVIFASQIFAANSAKPLEALHFLRKCLLVELLLILPASVTVCYILKKLLDHPDTCTKSFSCSAVMKNEELVARLQQELDKQRELGDQMKKLYDEVVEHDHLRTEFFSNISHELKTPISVILGAVQLIDHSQAVQEESRPAKHFHILKQNCFRLLRLINNILDTTRLEKGYIKTNMENSNIVYLIEEMTQSVVPFAQQKKLSLIFDTDEEEILTAVDIDKLERIMLNLLSNAIKFTPAGGSVIVCITKTGQRVTISVKDTGPGIPKHMQSRIFERYKQVNSTLTRDFEGSGIGLSLVKSFIELLGGTIRLISEAGKGSNFIIELPIEPCKNQPSYTNAYDQQSKIIQAINIEFSDIYTMAS